MTQYDTAQQDTNNPLNDLLIFGRSHPFFKKGCEVEPVDKLEISALIAISWDVFISVASPRQNKQSFKR